MLACAVLLTKFAQLLPGQSNLPGGQSYSQKGLLPLQCNQTSQHPKIKFANNFLFSDRAVRIAILASRFPTTQSAIKSELLAEQSDLVGWTGVCVFRPGQEKAAWCGREGGHRGEGRLRNILSTPHASNMPSLLFHPDQET